MKRLLRVLSLSRTGSVLIVCLWVIGFLILLAAGLSTISASRLRLTGHWRDNQLSYFIARAGVFKAMAELKKESISSWYDCLNEPWSHSPELFKEIELGDGSYTVSYKIGSGEAESIGYGLIDEERKLNINLIIPGALRELLKYLMGLTHNEAQAIANCIADWRDADSDLREGGAEDDYYQGLDNPYACKDGWFQVLEELLLVKGVTPEIYEELHDYLTIHGAAKVNINTASLPVLIALVGTNHEALAQKIKRWRAATDGIEGTDDDNICTNVAELINRLNQTEPLTTEEISLLNNLIIADLIDVVSECYQIKAEGTYRGKNTKRITCIAKAHDQKVWIVFWRQ